MAQGTESEFWFYNYSRVACGIMSRLFSVVFTGLIAVLSGPGTSWFSWHPFLMAFAFCLFMTEAILLFSPYGSPIQKLSHKTKGRFHWILQCLCASFATLGLVAIFYNKHLNGKPHFTTWHGLVGFGTLCVVGVQSLAALPLIYNSLAKGWSLAKLKRYHAASGLITYLLGTASLFLGICSTWFTAFVGGYIWYMVALCFAFNALVIMSQVTNAYMNRKRMQS